MSRALVAACSCAEEGDGDDGGGAEIGAGAGGGCVARLLELENGTSDFIVKSLVPTASVRFGLVFSVGHPELRIVM